MHKMKKLLMAITLAVIVVAPIGCQLTPERATAICPQVTSLAQRTADRIQKDSSDKEKARKGIETAGITFRQASMNTKLTFDDLAVILSQLPYGKLQDEETQLYVDAVTLAVILLFPNGAEFDVSKYESATIVAGCIADGLFLSIGE